MSDVLQLWLPIVLTAVFIFVASSLIHMVFKWHNADYRKLPNEDEVRAALNSHSLPPGLYTLPHCTDMKEMADPAMLKKFSDGPVGFLALKKAGPPTMGACLSQWFLLILAIAAIAALVTVQSVGIDAHPHRAAHLIGMLSFLAYSVSTISEGIWMAKPWSSVAKHVLDGLIYATISALTFLWLWPA